MRPVLVLLLAATLPAPPASASAEYAGRTCDLAAVRYYTFAGNELTGTVSAGPWTALDRGTSRVTTDVVISCELRSSLQLARPPWSSQSGAVAVLPPTSINFNADPFEPLTLCTTVTWTYANGFVETYRYDADIFFPGVQCVPVLWLGQDTVAVAGTAVTWLERT